MLSIGWTEMMIVAAIALIVVGPKDLPAMLRQIGKIAASARRMGNEFKAELNKVTALDEIRDIKKSISAPLNETRSKIESEFNTILPDGTVKPSGVIKPANPGAESVVDEIRSNAGMDSEVEEPGQAAKASIAAAVTRAAQSAEKPAAGAKTAKRAASKAAQGKAKAAKPAGQRAKTAKSRPAKAKAGANKASPTRAKATGVKATGVKATKARASKAAAAKRVDAPAKAGAKPTSKPLASKKPS